MELHLTIRTVKYWYIFQCKHELQKFSTGWKQPETKCHIAYIHFYLEHSESQSTETQNAAWQLSETMYSEEQLLTVYQGFIFSSGIVLKWELSLQNIVKSTKCHQKNFQMAIFVHYNENFT